MSTKKIGMLLATLMGVSMMLCGIASAGDNETLEIYFEMQAKGKGYAIATDNASAEDAVYTESKHKIDKITYYLRVDRVTKSYCADIQAVYYDSDNESWKSTCSGQAYESESSIFLNMCKKGAQINNTIDDIDIDAFGLMRAQLKLKDGILQSGRVKSLGLSYRSVDCPSGDPNQWNKTDAKGELKAKGKLIAWDDLPTEVQDAFEAPPGK